MHTFLYVGQLLLEGHTHKAEILCLWWKKTEKLVYNTKVDSEWVDNSMIYQWLHGGCTHSKQNPSRSLSVIQDGLALIHKYKKSQQSQDKWWGLCYILGFSVRTHSRVSVCTRSSTSPSCPAPSTLTRWAPVLCCEVNKLLRRSGSVYTGALLLMGTSWEWWRYMHSQTKPHI